MCTFGILNGYAAFAPLGIDTARPIKHFNVHMWQSPKSSTSSAPLRIIATTLQMADVVTKKMSPKAHSVALGSSHACWMCRFQAAPNPRASEGACGRRLGILVRCGSAAILLWWDPELLGMNGLAEAISHPKRSWGSRYREDPACHLSS